MLQYYNTQTQTGGNSSNSKYGKTGQLFSTLVVFEGGNDKVLRKGHGDVNNEDNQKIRVTKNMKMTEKGK